MMKRSILLTLGALLVAALLTVTCGSPSTALPTQALPTQALPSTALPSTALPSAALPSAALPTAEPSAGETPTGDLIYGKANVDAIDIRILESFPVQVHVIATGFLPDGCTEIDTIQQSRSGQNFQVTITTVRPAGAMCTQALEAFEETIALDVYGLAAGRYTVDVNGVAGAFELAVDNAPPTEPEGDDTANTPTPSAGSVERSATLTIDEWPVVAADVDNPSHFEYLDRLGEEQLARLDGLRQRAAERRLDQANEALAPFGYRLEARFDAEWNHTFFDLYTEDAAEPLASGLSRFWPVSVDASGTDFVMVAENAPNVLPLYLQVTTAGVTEWDPTTSVWLSPVYVGDRLATIATTGDVTLTYQVLLDQQAVYTGTALFLVDNPFRTLAYCGGRWVLEVDDHLIVDGQDLTQIAGYDAIFGFTELHGQPFYFFEKDGQVRISYAGKTLPNVYDEVVHNQCCEPAMFNVETHPDVVVFHARWQGTWYLVEAGLFEGEMSSTWRYVAPEGWSFRYPAHWDVLDAGSGFVQESATGKTVTFGSAPSTQAELEEWIEAEIARKLAATEAENMLAEPLSVSQEGDLAVYRYAIRSGMEGSDTLLRTTLFFDGERRYEFGAAIPPVAEEEYEAIVVSFRPAP